MKEYISMFRGINVGGHKKIKMEALRNWYEELGFKNMQTYIQSGNLIFKSPERRPRELEKKIAGHIAKTTGFAVPVVVLELAELAAALENNPFAGHEQENSKALHLTFLAEEPSPGNIENLKNGHYAPDEYSLSGKFLYLLCTNGYGKTKLTNNFLENKLAVGATTRNWKTVMELVKRASAIH